MNATLGLDEINRIHDDEPQRAASALRELDMTSLPADQLPLLAFLLRHVLGEKLELWSEAAERLERLRADRADRADVPLAVVAQAAVAAHVAGVPHNAALSALAADGGEAQARALVELNALDCRPAADPAALAAELKRLADASQSFGPDSILNRQFAIGFNNTTSRLLDLAAAPVEPAIGAALLAGSAAALHFWLAAGNWVNHERALYLRALVHNRVGDAAAALADCRQALEVIAANGAQDVDGAFLKLQLAGALLRLGETVDGQRTLREARAAAAQWDDAGLKSWFEDEVKRLFGSSEPQT